MSATGTALVPPSGLNDVLARIGALDARLRSLDPAWVGLSGAAGSSWTGQAGVGTAAGTNQMSATSFADALSGARAGTNAARLAGTAVGDGVHATEATRLVEPVAGAQISQPFGPTTLSLEPSAVVDGVQYAHFHDGLDLAAPLGTPVVAAAAGTVTSAGRQSDGAVVVRIRHDDGSESLYGHLDPDLAVSAGDRVVAGERIGSVGLTGRTTGPHVHFELVVGGRTVDPEPWLEAGHLPGAPATAAASGSAASGSSSSGSAGSASASAGRAFDAVADRIPYSDSIRKAAAAAGIDPLLLASLVRAESGFRPDAISSAGALGLTQLMPANVSSMGVGNPFDPDRNLAAGARYLANNLHLYGRVDLALAAYQAGKGAVARAGGIPDSPTTRNYVSRILGYWAGYLDQSQEAAA